MEETMVEFFVLVLLFLGLFGAGLWWLGRYAWALMHPGRTPAHYRRSPDQIANQRVAEHYDEHHPRVHSVRFRRRNRKSNM